jgi:hypothetical protein
MRMNEIRELLRAEPFQPFTLFVTDGRTFEIRHPEFVILSPFSIEIAVPGSDSPVPLPDRRIVSSLLHVTGYEQIHPTLPPTSN